MYSVCQHVLTIFNFYTSFFCVKINEKREKMKSLTSVLLMALVLAPAHVRAAAPLSGTAGSNLTAYNPGGGAVNNNTWNNMMNSRSGGGGDTTAKADFGNCNSVILRCASPKCATGGCATMDIARPIVAGCVSSNEACKKYGDELIDAISAQLVASSTAKANAQMVAAQNAAAEQSNMQMQQMQQQMAEMQQQMAAQNEAQIAQLQAALEEQKQMTAQAIADSNSAAEAAAAANQNFVPESVGAVASAGAESSAGVGATPTTVMEGLTEAQRIAAAAGVSADILAREQVAGQIMTDLENAEVQLKKAKAAMEDAFSYAGCDSKGDNCIGPKRVTVFRQKAMDFFEPYDAVLDDLYTALSTAQTIGVDIGDIYMMMDGSCNVWGEYLCYGGTITTWEPRQVGQATDGTPIYEKDKDGSTKYYETTGWAKYTTDNCPTNGGQSRAANGARGVNPHCYIDTTIPPEDSTSCTLNRTLADMEEVQRNFLFAEEGDIDERKRIGCASSVLENSKFFRGRKKASNIDIETLERIVSQDAPAMFGSNRYGQSLDPTIDGPKYCAVNPKSYMELQKAVSLKKLPARICVTDKILTNTFMSEGVVTAADTEYLERKNAQNGSKYKKYEIPTTKEDCERVYGTWDRECKCDGAKDWVKGHCAFM